MSGARDRLDDSRGSAFDEVSGVRRWGPLLIVMIALAVVLATVATAVYVGRLTRPHATANPTPPATTARRLAGQRCIALNLTAVGAPAAKVAGSYRLRVLVGDRGPSCVLSPSAVRLLAEGHTGVPRVFAAPTTAVLARPAVVVDYEVVFARRCSAHSGSEDVLLSVGGSLLDASGATIPRGLASCHAVTRVSAYR